MVVLEMSQRDGFTGGFLAGAVVGGVVGAIVGALVASGRATDTEAQDASLLNSGTSEAKTGKAKKLQLRDSDSIEVARRSLEDKIAQLNAAIDEVRTQLGPVNGNAVNLEREKARSLESDP